MDRFIKTIPLTAIVTLALFLLVSCGGGGEDVVTPVPSFAPAPQTLDEISLVSVDSSGVQANNSSYSSSISNDGRYIVFDSVALNLATDDNNSATDIFVRDTWAPKTTTLVSVSPTEVKGNYASSSPAISGDGAFIAFASAADNLLAATDSNSHTDIFVHENKVKGDTIRVSISTAKEEANNNSGSPSISTDGNVIAFSSDATNLVGDDTNAVTDIFIHDRSSGETTRVSVNDGLPGDPGHNQGNNKSLLPSISGNGLFVAFYSEADNLVAGDSNHTGDVFIRNTVANTTTLVSVNPAKIQGNKVSSSPSVSESGQYIAFYSLADNLVPNDTNGCADVFVRDKDNNITTRVSVDSNGIQGNKMSYAPSISSDGRFVVFISAADNLVEGDTNEMADIFVHDRQTDSTKTLRVSVGLSGIQGNGGSYFSFNNGRTSAISTNGQSITFVSNANNLVDNDTNNAADVFFVSPLPY